MSKYSLVYCTDRDLPEWLVVSGYSVKFKSFSREEALTIFEEYMIQEQAAEIDYFHNQESEFDYA